MDDKKFCQIVSERAGCDERRAEALTFAVFHELHDRLTPREADDVSAQMPRNLKMLWKSFDRPNRQVRRVHLEEFLGEVRKMAVLPNEAEARRAVIAVFHALQRLLGSPTGREGEAWDVLSQLPMDLKELWLSASKEKVQ